MSIGEWKEIPPDELKVEIESSGGYVRAKVSGVTGPGEVKIFGMPKPGSLLKDGDTVYIAPKLVLRYEDAPPDYWLLETEDGMWVATFPRLVPAFQDRQKDIIRGMVDAYNKTNAPGLASQILGMTDVGEIHAFVREYLG